MKAAILPELPEPSIKMPLELDRALARTASNWKRIRSGHCANGRRCPAGIGGLRAGTIRR